MSVSHQVTDEFTIKTKLLKLVEEQANDDGLWFDARYITEAYLQQELRKLHALIEELCQ